MFGVGVGMLYTPILVDRMELLFPSGFAVANILRALSDRELLKRSIAKLASGMAAGYVIGVSSLNISWFTRFGLSGSAVAVLEKAAISASTLGAGMIVGARIVIPALVVGLIGIWQTPHLISIGWLHPGDPFRKNRFHYFPGHNPRRSHHRYYPDSDSSRPAIHRKEGRGGGCSRGLETSQPGRPHCLGLVLGDRHRDGWEPGPASTLVFSSNRSSAFFCVCSS